MGKERRTWDEGGWAPISGSSSSVPHSPLRLVVARHRFDGADDLLVGHLVGGAGEGGVAPVHQDHSVVLGVATEGIDQLPPFRVVEGTKVHELSPSRKQRTDHLGQSAKNRPLHAWADSSANNR